MRFTSFADSKMFFFCCASSACSHWKSPLLSQSNDDVLKQCRDFILINMAEDMHGTKFQHIFYVQFVFWANRSRLAQDPLSHHVLVTAVGSFRTSDSCHLSSVRHRAARTYAIWAFALRTPVLIEWSTVISSCAYHNGFHLQDTSVQK